MQPSGKAGVSPHLQSKQAGVQPQTGFVSALFGLVSGDEGGRKKDKQMVSNITVLE